MGSTSSYYSLLGEELLEEYTALTYLTRNEILKLLKTFLIMDPNKLHSDISYRFPIAQIEEIFPQLKHNPFKDRIYQVFSSRGDMRFSFEDMLDLCSVMSENCPDNVKAKWAFKLFDFDGDGYVGEEDLAIAISRLVKQPNKEDLGPDNRVELDDKDNNYIISVLMQGIGLQNNGKINHLEFEHAIGKMSEFPQAFSFRI